MTSNVEFSGQGKGVEVYGLSEVPQNRAADEQFQNVDDIKEVIRLLREQNRLNQEKFASLEKKLEIQDRKICKLKNDIRSLKLGQPGWLESSSASSEEEEKKEQANSTLASSVITLSDKERDDLCKASSYFTSMFKKNFQESGSNVLRLQASEVEPLRQILGILKDRDVKNPSPAPKLIEAGLSTVSQEGSETKLDSSPLKLPEMDTDTLIAFAALAHKWEVTPIYLLCCQKIKEGMNTLTFTPEDFKVGREIQKYSEHFLGNDPEITKAWSYYLTNYFLSLKTDQQRLDWLNWLQIQGEHLKIETLTLDSDKWLLDTDLAPLCHFTNLQTLHLVKCSELTRKGLVKLLSKLTRLKTFLLSWPLPVSELNFIREKWPHLHIKYTLDADKMNPLDGKNEEEKKLILIRQIQNILKQQESKSMMILDLGNALQIKNADTRISRYSRDRFGGLLNLIFQYSTLFKVSGGSPKFLVSLN